jgi:propanol-preferring alcohol dehydrogenase
MKAVRLHPENRVEVEEVAEPAAGPGQVVVEVKAAGVCGTDLHAVHGRLPVPDLPVVMGHEGAGVISELGEGVADRAVGDRVLLLPSETCGTCGPCLDGHLGLCASAQIFGMARDGTFAQRVVASSSCTLALPDTVPFEHGAILADAVATAYHAVATRGALQAGESLAVVGCGGVGYHVLLLARILGAGTIVAVDASEGALEKARAAGADACVDGRADDAHRQVRQAVGGEGPACVIEFVGGEATVSLALRCVARSGRVVLGGVGMDRPRLPPLISFIGKEISITGSMGYTRAELERVVELAAAGTLDLSQSITERYPLEDAASAFADLDSRRNSPIRLALIP